MPTTLWLEEFEEKKWRKIAATPPPPEFQRQVYAPPGSARLNFPDSGGRSDLAVSHKLHVAELNKLPEKPNRSANCRDDVV